MKPYKYKWEARFRVNGNDVIRQYAGHTMRDVNQMMLADAERFDLPDCFYGCDGNGYEGGEYIHVVF